MSASIPEAMSISSISIWICRSVCLSVHGFLFGCGGFFVYSLYPHVYFFDGPSIYPSREVASHHHSQLLGFCKLYIHKSISIFRRPYCICFHFRFLTQKNTYFSCVKNIYISLSNLEFFKSCKQFSCHINQCWFSD